MSCMNVDSVPLVHSLKIPRNLKAHVKHHKASLGLLNSIDP